jgi:heme-degrading monooxygenase HmoA
MIARIWRGLTPATKAQDYLTYLKRTGLTDYQKIEGNRGVTVLLRTREDKAEFVIISFWDSLDAIRKFAGEDYEKARYYPEDKDYLLNFEPTVEHFEVSFTD